MAFANSTGHGLKIFYIKENILYKGLQMLSGWNSNIFVRNLDAQVFNMVIKTIIVITTIFLFQIPLANIMKILGGDFFSVEMI